MSRSRPITTPFGDFWIDRKKDGERATHYQLEVLAGLLDCDMDDVLDQFMTQGEVVRRIRAEIGQGVPPEVVARIEAARIAREVAPECRVCGAEGDSTLHHFVNKWILRELEYYEQKWASRTRNCIPVCIDCHRDLHARDDGSHSIADLLSDDEKEFAEAALSALAEERPKLLILIARGSDNTYETRLVRDWMEGRFGMEAEPASTVAYLRVVQ